MRTLPLLALLVTTASADAGVPVYDMRVAIDPDGIVVEGTATVSDLRDLREFVLRRDMRLIAAEIRVPDVIPLNSTASPEGELTRWFLTPERPAAGPGTVWFRAEGGTETTLNFAVAPDVAFAGGSTHWYPRMGAGRGTGVVHYQVPPGWIVVASGSRRDDGNAFQSDHPTYFEFAAGPFTTTREGAIAVHLMERRGFEGDLIRVARGVLGVLEEEFGPYPYSSFSVVEVPTDVAASSGFIGAAFEGFMLVRSDFLLRTGADIGHFGHEIAHQWWGVGVQKTGSKGEYMLDEALAQYGALRAVEALDGPGAAREFRRGVRGLGGLHDAIELLGADLDWPLSTLPRRPAAYRLADTKGYLVWEMLAREIGRERFRAALRSAVREHLHDVITWEQLIEEIREHGGSAVDRFVTQWMERAAMPVLELEWSRTAEGDIIIAVTQKGTLYDVSIPATVTWADGSSEVLVLRLAGPRTETRTPDRGVTGVELDPGYSVVHATTGQLERAVQRAQVTRGVLAWDHDGPQVAAEYFKSALASAPAEDVAAVEFLASFYLGWIEEEAGRPARALALYDNALRSPVRVEQRASQLLERISIVAEREGDWQRTCVAARGVISAELAHGPATRRTEEARSRLRRHSGRGGMCSTPVSDPGADSLH